MPSAVESCCWAICPMTAPYGRRSWQRKGHNMPLSKTSFLATLLQSKLDGEESIFQKELDDRRYAEVACPVGLKFIQMSV